MILLATIQLHIVTLLPLRFFAIPSCICHIIVNIICVVTYIFLDVFNNLKDVIHFISKKKKLFIGCNKVKKLISKSEVDSLKFFSIFIKRIIKEDNIVEFILIKDLNSSKYSIITLTSMYKK